MSDSTFDFSNMKSSTSIIRKYTDLVEKRILLEDETLSTIPTSFVNLQAQFLAAMAENSFYERQMYTREMEPSVALRMKTILRKLKDSEVTEVFATPARMTFIIGFPDDEIYKNAVDHPNGDKRLRIGKDIAIYLADKPPFRMYHDLDIIVSTSVSGQKTINGMFDISDRNPAISPIESPFINVQTGVFFDGKSHTFFHIPMTQIERHVVDYRVNVDGLDRVVPFEGNLVGFEVKYKFKEDSPWNILPGVVDGISNPDGYTFDISDNGLEKKIRFSFNRIKGAFSPSEGIVKITIFTTDGSLGNFTIEGEDPSQENLNLEFKQDRSDPYQDSVSRITPLITFKDRSSTGGSDFPTIEELRTRVIENSGTRDVITPGRITQEASKVGLSARRVRNDVMIMEYLMSGTVDDPNSRMTFPTTFANVSFKIDEVPINTETRSRLLTPKDTFTLDSGKSEMRYNKNPKNFVSYIEDFENGIGEDYHFPFFIRIAANQYITPKVYDLSTDETYFTNFKYYNDKTRDRVTIDRIQVKRNAVSDDHYSISFVAAANPELIEFLLQNPEQETVKFRLGIQNVRGMERFVSKIQIAYIDPQTNTIEFHCEFKTNNGILQNSNKLNITDNTLEPIPYSVNPVSFYFIEPIVNLSIYYIVQDENNIVRSQYDSVLTQEEVSENYSVMTVYDVNQVTFVKDLSELFRLTVDVRTTQPVYAKYETDQPDRYTENVYEYNEDGSIVKVEQEITYPDGRTEIILKPVIIHSKGDVKLDENGDPIIKHFAGETTYGPDGRPIIVTPSKTEFVIINLPVYNRIFESAEWYFRVIEGFNDLAERVSDIRSRIPDGCHVKLGVQKTTSKGSYKFENIQTKQIEVLDNVALSLSIGVKMDIVNFDREFVSTQISNEIIRLINENRKSNEISFTEIFNKVKSNIPNVKFYEIDRINSYDAGECQTIFRDSDQTDEILGVRYNVDRSSSNIETGDIKFKPDITIRFIP